MRAMLVVAALLTAAASLSHGQTQTVATIHRGWYRADGLNNPENRNYITGNLGSNPPNGPYRSFFVFDLTQVTNHIASAELQLQNPVFGYTSADSAEILGLFDVTTPFSLLTNGTGGTAAFDDLGTGTLLGAATVDESMNYGYTVPVDLNTNGVAALNAARGGMITFGGTVLTLDGHLDEHIFSRSSASEYTGLLLRTVPDSDVPGPQPVISIESVSILEGNIYTNQLAFSLSLSTTSSQPVWVGYFTSNGTAQAGTDYVATNGGVFFAPGVTNCEIRVVLWSNIAPEPDEVFHLYLPDSVNGILATNHAAASILNDDGLPGIPSIFVLSAVASPGYLRQPFPLSVTMKDAFGDTVSNYAGGAMLWGRLTNAPAFLFDFSEGDFSQWTPLDPPQSPGPYQIVPFDVAGHGCPSLAFRLAADWNAPDGVSRPLTLSAGMTYAFWADIAAFNENGTYFNFTPGQVGIMINNQILTNFDFGTFGYIGPLQTFRTNLLTTFTAPTNGTYQLTIRFARGVPQADVWNYVDNVRMTPAAILPRWIAGFTNGVWTGQIDPIGTALGLQLLAQSPEGYLGTGNIFAILPAADLALSGTSSPSLARAGSDLVFSFTVTNRGPSIATNVVVTNILASTIRFRSAVLGQGSYSYSNGVVICNLGNLTNGQRCTISITTKPYVPGATTNFATVTSFVFDPNTADNSVTAAVTADLPLLHLDNLSVTEGNSGTTNAPLSLWLEGAVGIPLSLDYATADGSALSGSDYVSAAGSLAIPVGVTNVTVSVPLLGDVIWEPTETLALSISNLVNAVANQQQAVITIADNDPLPSISIGDVSLVEGNSAGTIPAQFPVTLSNPSSAQIRVFCRTTNGTATHPNDYLNTTATLTFPPGSTNQIFQVPVVGDTNNEPDQAFRVILSSPVGALMARGSATATILNDDAAPGKLLRFAFDPVASPQLVSQPFPITIRALDHLEQPAGFSGAVVLSAQTDEFLSPIAHDDFEDGDLAGWTNFATALLQFSNVTDTASAGTHSLKLSGKAASALPTSSLRQTFTNSKPNHVRFNVRAAQTNAITGRLWLVGGGLRAFDFYLNKDGRMGLSTNSGFTGVGYQSQRWYAVDVELDWTTKNLNCRIDGTLAITNCAFLDPSTTSADYIALQNTEAGVSWFDSFQIASTYFTNLFIAPSNVTSFVNGAWTGSVMVQPAATNVYLTVTDLEDHVGTSGFFQVMAPEVIRFTQIQLQTNGIFRMSVEGALGETYMLWTSTNLNDWMQVRTFVCTNAPTIVTDSSNPNDQQRFYRIVRQLTSP